MDQDLGIESVIDPNGHTLSYSDAGIVHSAGKVITFNRVTEGRITTITDPKGNIISYGYSAAGDLTTVTDRTLVMSPESGLQRWNNIKHCYFEW